MNDYLEHHGILGQRWGVRRFQNPDGTLTKRGAKRYGTNLDVNDKSRKNVAKIRTGEARRRLDVARNNNETNTVRIADLQARVRSAKKMEKTVKKIDKGAALAAKGQTITGNKSKTYIASGAAVMGSKIFSTYLDNRLSTLSAQGRLTPQHERVASALKLIGKSTLNGAAFAYAAKKSVDNNNIRAYNNARLYGDTSLKRIGSQEYADVVKRSKNN